MPEITKTEKIISKNVVLELAVRGDTSEKISEKLGVPLPKINEILNEEIAYLGQNFQYLQEQVRIIGYKRLDFLVAKLMPSILDLDSQAILSDEVNGKVLRTIEAIRGLIKDQAKMMEVDKVTKSDGKEQVADVPYGVTIPYNSDLYKTAREAMIADAPEEIRNLLTQDDEKPENIEEDVWDN